MRRPFWLFAETGVAGPDSNVKNMRTQLETMSRPDDDSRQVRQAALVAQLQSVVAGNLSKRSSWRAQRDARLCVDQNAITTFTNVYRFGDLANYKRHSQRRRRKVERIMFARLVLVRAAACDSACSYSGRHSVVLLSRLPNVTTTEGTVDVLIGHAALADSVGCGIETPGLRKPGSHSGYTGNGLLVFAFAANVSWNVMPDKICRPFQTGQQAFRAKTEWPGHYRTHGYTRPSLRRIPLELVSVLYQGPGHSLGVSLNWAGRRQTAALNATKMAALFVLGTVTDASGAPVRGAQIVCPNIVYFGQVIRGYRFHGKLFCTDFLRMPPPTSIRISLAARSRHLDSICPDCVDRPSLKAIAVVVQPPAQRSHC